MESLELPMLAAHCFLKRKKIRIILFEILLYLNFPLHVHIFLFQVVDFGWYILQEILIAYRFYYL